MHVSVAKTVVNGQEICKCSLTDVFLKVSLVKTIVTISVAHECVTGKTLAEIHCVHKKKESVFVNTDLLFVDTFIFWPVIVDL